MSPTFPVATPGVLERDPEACREPNDVCFTPELQRAQNGHPPLSETPRARPDRLLKALEEGGSRVQEDLGVLPVVPADDVVRTHLLRVGGRKAVEDTVSHWNVGLWEVSETSAAVHIADLLQLRNLDDSVFLHPGKHGYLVCRAQLPFGYPVKLDCECPIPIPLLS